MMPDMNRIIELAHKLTKEQGIAVRGGKKYSTVATRVELFRKHFDGWGIETEAMKVGEGKGQGVIVKATVTDEKGAVKATGHASEVVGAGNVNATSALENAETSAIGRALSCLGLHGGEYASINEIEGVGRKAEAQKPMADDPALANEPEPNVPQHDSEIWAITLIDGSLSLSSLKVAWQQIDREYGGNVPHGLVQRTNKRKRELAKTDPQAPAEDAA